MSNELWIAGIIFLVLGAVLTIAGYILKSYNSSQRPFEGIAEANVVEIISVEQDKNTETEFHNSQVAVFEFYAGGKPVKVRDKEGHYPCPYKLHQQVLISYNPDNPSVFCVLQKENKRYWATVLNILAVICILIGVLLFMRYALRYI